MVLEYLMNIIELLLKEDLKKCGYNKIDIIRITLEKLIEDVSKL